MTDDDELNNDRIRLETQMDKMKARRAGFVIVDDQAIWGIGETEEAAWADARRLAEIPDNAEREGSFLCFDATAALLELVRERGGNVATCLVGATACTVEEGEDW